MTRHRFLQGSSALVKAIITIYLGLVAFAAPAEAALMMIISKHPLRVASVVLPPVLIWGKHLQVLDGVRGIS